MAERTFAAVPPQPDIVKVRSLAPAGGGQPLEPGQRQQYEHAFGQDLSHVRVHAGAGVADLVRSVGAYAFTAGRDIVVGPDAPSSGTAEGHRILAHELAHVVQQRAAVPTRPGSTRYSTRAEESEADGAARAVQRGTRVGALSPRPYSIACDNGPTSPVPKVIPTGRRAIIQWGSDPATTFNAEALRSGSRSGPNAAGANTLLKPSELGADSLAQMRELEVVIHGVPSTADPSGLRPGELTPRADVGVPGLPAGAHGPVENISPEAMAQRLTAAGFGKGRWTYYRVRLVMCFGGVGESTSYASRLAAALAKLGVQAETLGGLGRVSATGTRLTELPPRGGGKPRASAQPGPGVPQAEQAYAEPGAPRFPMRRPGTGWQRVPPGAKLPPTGASPAPAATGGAEPVRPAGEAAAPAAKSVRRPGGAGRIGLGAAKFFGPMILDAVTNYFVQQHEQKVIAQAITAKLDSADVKSRLTELFNEMRLIAAYRQRKGETLYVTIDLRLAMTNDILDTIELSRVRLADTDETSSMTTVMSHDAIVGGEHKVRYESISFQLDAVALTDVEKAKQDLRLFDEPGPSADPEARKKLEANVRVAEEREEAAKLAHIRSAAVHADPKDRAAEQADVAERLRKLPPASPAAARVEDKPAPTGTGLLPSPGVRTEPPITLLPGAAGASPIEQAKQAVDAFERSTSALLARGRALEGRLGGNQRPTDAERQEFFAEEQRWRLIAKYLQNHFKTELRTEALNRVGELMDRNGPLVDQLRIHLGG